MFFLAFRLETEMKGNRIGHEARKTAANEFILVRLDSLVVCVVNVVEFDPNEIKILSLKIII